MSNSHPVLENNSDVGQTRATSFYADVVNKLARDTIKDSGSKNMPPSESCTESTVTYKI